MPNDTAPTAPAVPARALVAVRPGRPDDVPALAAVHVQAWRETYPGILSDELLANLRVEDHERLWTTILTGEWASGVVVGLLDDVVSGFAFAYPSPEPDAPRDLELNMIYALERAKGTGLGQAMLDAAIGERPALVWVAINNPRARGFYARNGFQPDGASKIIERWDNVHDIRLVR